MVDDKLKKIYQLGGEGGVIGDGLLGGLVGKMRGLGMWVVGSAPGVKEGVMRRAN